MKTNIISELFTMNGETFKKGDRVTVITVDTYDAHISTEAGTLTDYSRSMALAEVTTDDGRRVYGHFGDVKHAPTDPTPTPGGKGVEGIQKQTEGTTPVIEAPDSHRICTAQDGISPNGIEADAQTTDTNQESTIIYRITCTPANGQSWTTYKDTRKEAREFVDNFNKKYGHAVCSRARVELTEHHTATARGYISKGCEYRESYAGKFGTGFILHHANADRPAPHGSNKYHVITYFIEK